jgi:hypothetical protein
MAGRRLPNFFIVGASKSGTTSLARYLSQHPAVYMSRLKEPCFFAPEVLQWDRTIVVEWEAYLKLFEDAHEETAIGEASTAYLPSRNAPGAIRDRIPGARILMLLRDPAERLYSHYTAALAAGRTPPGFQEWLDRQLAVEAATQPRFGPVEIGRYAQHLGRYLEAFPASRLHVLLYDDFERDPARAVAGAFQFLGVDPNVAIDVRVRHNATLVARWPSLHRYAGPIRSAIRRVSPETLNRLRRWTRRPARSRPAPAERARMLEIYAADIRELQALIHRDLTRWLTPAPERRLP